MSNWARAELDNERTGHLLLPVRASSLHSVSIAVMSKVWQNSGASGTKLLLLLAIADFADDAGRAYPGVETLAKKSRMSERNTRYALKALVQSGELDIERGAGRNGTNVYHVRVSAVAGVSEGLQPVAPAKFAPLQPSVAGGANQRHKGVQPVAPEPSLNHQKNRHAYTPAFESAWDIYPQRAGDNPKVEAFKKWNARLQAGRTEVQMFEGVQRYRAFCDSDGITGTRFVKQGARFFGESEAFMEPWTLSTRSVVTRTNFSKQDYSVGLSEGGTAP